MSSSFIEEWVKEYVGPASAPVDIEVAAQKAAECRMDAVEAGILSSDLNSEIDRLWRGKDGLTGYVAACMVRKHEEQLEIIRHLEATPELFR
jgi:hypothetical protein